MKNQMFRQSIMGEAVGIGQTRPLRNKSSNEGVNFKKAAVQCILLANRLIAEQKYKQAKDLLIDASSYCREVDTPDDYTKKLMELCYEQTTIINKEAIKKRRKERRLDTYDRIIYEKSHQVVIMPFDKVMGQFTLQEHHKLLFELEDSPEKVLFNREIQFQVSKLNAIVFDYNNTEHDSSLAHMYGIYKTEVFVTGILCILLLVALFMSAQILGYISSSLSSDTLELLTIVIPSCAFVCPLLMIYLRQGKDKNPKLYQLRLEEELDRINQLSQQSCSYSLDNSNNLCIIMRGHQPPKQYQSLFS